MAGAWLTPWCWPWGLEHEDRSFVSTGWALRDTNSEYPLLPIVLHDNALTNSATTLVEIPGNVYGELDGVFHVSGFNNAVENTLVIGGTTYVVIQDVARTGHTDYVAIRMDD